MGATLACQGLEGGDLSHGLARRPGQVKVFSEGLSSSRERHPSPGNQSWTIEVKAIRRDVSGPWTAHSRKAHRRAAFEGSASQPWIPRCACTTTPRHPWPAQLVVKSSGSFSPRTSRDPKLGTTVLRRAVVLARRCGQLRS